MALTQRLLLLMLCLFCIGGCTTYGPSNALLGLDREQVIEALGPPTHTRRTESGELLEYARGPYGRHTFFITLNPSGRVERWEQVLQERNFKKIVPGVSRDDVRSLIGQSFEVVRLGRNRGEVWSYRYETPFCVWFQVEFDQEGVVRSAGDGIPPECLNRRGLLGL